MRLTLDTLQRRLAAVRERVDAACLACGRDAASVAILPVTKTHPAAVVELAVAAGFATVGENRVQEVAQKQAALATPVRWELIGHLQSNKTRQAVALFECIQTVDRSKLVERLDRDAVAAGRRLSILLQVNAGDDPAKYGASLQEAPMLLEAALAAEALDVDGLMTIAPLDDDPEVARRCFEALRDLRDDLAERFGVALPELSMGMSGDLESAVAAGSTMIRVGSALFGERPTP